MRSAIAAALVLMGAASFYALGRWGGPGPAERLLPLLGADRVGLLPALFLGIVCLAASVLLFRGGIEGVKGRPRAGRSTPLDIVRLANGSIVLLCLAAITVGAVEGWNPRTIGALAIVAVLELAIGLVLGPDSLRKAGSSSACLLSFGMVSIGAAWAISIAVLGLMGA